MVSTFEHTKWSWYQVLKTVSLAGIWRVYKSFETSINLVGEWYCLGSYQTSRVLGTSVDTRCRSIHQTQQLVFDHGTSVGAGSPKARNTTLGCSYGEELL
jgi:hypothetical protein